MMRSPLLQALMDEHQYPLLTEDNVDEFLQDHDDVVLFFSENPKHFPEANDVAVILPQLVAQFGDRLTPGVVDEAAERALHKRYGFNKWPALVFLRRGDYIGVITGMQNWAEFQAEFERMLAANPGRAPEFAIPVVAQE
jgi:hydrogenase-1 operon protein HyaE